MLTTVNAKVSLIYTLSKKFIKYIDNKHVSTINYVKMVVYVEEVGFAINHDDFDEAEC